MSSRTSPPTATGAGRIVEVAGPPRLSLRERVERARKSLEVAALERLRHDMRRQQHLSR